MEIKQPTENSIVHRQVVSIAQDIIHSTSKGRIHTPKHMLLPLTIHSMTGNKNAVTLLNLFGHGISYTQLEEVQTAMAERHLERTHEGEVFFPSNINPSSRVSLCFDNNDISEETLSGSGTTHCTNGVMIQKQMDSQYAVDNSNVAVGQRSKSRTITPPAPSIEQYYHNR